MPRILFTLTFILTLQLLFAQTSYDSTTCKLDKAHFKSLATDLLYLLQQ